MEVSQGAPSVPQRAGPNWTYLRFFPEIRAPPHLEEEEEEKEVAADAEEEDEEEEEEEAGCFCMRTVEAGEEERQEVDLK